MKKALAILISLCLFAQCIAQLGVIGYYQLNKEYIAKNLCENRAAPEKKCCGKCYLRKQLKKVSDSDGSTNNSGRTVKIEKTEVICVLPAACSWACTVPQSAGSVQNPLINHFLPASYCADVFHPPATC